MLQKLVAESAQYPEYSIVLSDMSTEGNFFPEYYHKYRVVIGSKNSPADTALTYSTFDTDWTRVDENTYRKYYDYLGMVILSKSEDGSIATTAYPPGYQYVGNPRYGHWRRDGSGNSFWEFYGKYAFFSSMFGLHNRPIYRNDWDNYRTYRRAGRPYYGYNNSYGTNGKYTKRTHPAFYTRQKQKIAAKKSRFSDKVKKRMQRSKMSSTRRRSSGFGK